MMDASSGYISWSMSKRTAQAYADGEMPKSKWTKAAMAEAIKVCCDENDLAYDPAVERLAKTALFDRFFYRSSWHHTSKFFNATDFYAVDEDAVMAAFRPMTGEELAARDTALEERIREAREAYERQQARCSDMEAYRKEHGFRPDSAAAFMLVHPERCHERIARKSHNRHVCFEHGCDMTLPSRMRSPRLWTGSTHLTRQPPPARPSRRLAASRGMRAHSYQQPAKTCLPGRMSLGNKV